MRISELADATHETPRTIRFYESKGLLPPPARTPSGYRDYDSCAIPQILFIRSLQGAGLTLDHIAGLAHLSDSSEQTSPSRALLLASVTSRVEHQLNTLTRMRTQFAELARDTASKSKRCDCARTNRAPSAPTETKDR